MQRYNIALLPIDSTFKEEIIRISRLFFADIHDDYILGTEGLPHVTLCQFKADSPDTALDAYERLIASENLTVPDKLSIEKFQVRAGTLVNSGTFIAEYKITPDKNLIDLQFRCAEVLDTCGLKNLTPSQKYSPHITLARLLSVPKQTPTIEDLQCAPEFKPGLSLGLSTESGVFTKSLRS